MPVQISGSPDISLLDFNILYDISSAIPAITLTNQSVGVPSGNMRLNLCTWWYVITSPNGSPVHIGSLATPDYAPAANSWTVLSIPPYSWPTPFGTPPCGQVEFSSSVPYTCTLYVKDTANTTYQLQKTTIIARPNGSKTSTCGSFGSAAVSVQTQCAQAKIYAVDTTDYTYQGIIGTSFSSIWTMRYPESESGTLPPNATANNASYVLFPIGYAGKGYTLYLNTFAIYDLGGGCNVKVQYKLYDNDCISVGKTFAVYCNVDLCKLDCKMQEMYDLLQTSCAEITDPTLSLKVQKLQLLYTRVMTGVFQPLCGIDVPAIIEEMERIGGFTCDCHCAGGINIGSAAIPGGSGGCCPVYVGVIDKGTGAAPANCPNGYFPANIFDPTGNTVIGVARTASDEINIINSNAAWQAYGTAFDTGNCTVGFYPINPAATIPSVKITSIVGGTGTGTVVVNVIDATTSNPPISCPASYFPAQIFDPTGAINIGVASDVNQMVGMINGYTAWQAYGVAFVVDNCHVGFYPKAGVGTIPVVKVHVNGTTSTGCTNGTQAYPITISDLCYPANTTITPANFPMNVYVDFGLGAGKVFVTNAASQAAMITALNAAPTKPASITFAAGSTLNQVNVTNTNCTAYSAVITVYADFASSAYITYGGNHFDTAGSLPLLTPESEYAFGIQALAKLGKFPAFKGMLWHSVRIGNILMSTSPDYGAVYFWNITNPLMPTIARIIALNKPVTNCFSGVPTSVTAATNYSPVTPVKTIYDLYFPTDVSSTMSLSNIYVVETLTGSAWHLDYTAPGTGIVASFQDNKLIGKCPRVLFNGKIYFSQDGDLEQATSQSSGVAVGDVVILDTATFSSGGLSTTTIIPNLTENVWSASYDGSNNIYFVGQKSTVVQYSLVTNAVVNLYPTLAGGTTAKFRLNTLIFGGNLYFTPNVRQVTPDYVSFFTPIAGLATPVITFFQTPPSAMQGMFTLTPLGNCILVLTSGYIGGGVFIANNQMVLYKTDGTYLAAIPLLSGEEFFNVVPIGNIAVTTPNNFI